MNTDNVKKWIKNYRFYIIAFLSGALFACSVLIPCYFHSTGERDRRAAELEGKLAAANNSLEYAAGTIQNCNTRLAGIAGELAVNSTDLSGIIQKLRTIQKEVHNMENDLYNYYSSCSTNNSNADMEKQEELD